MFTRLGGNNNPLAEIYAYMAIESGTEPHVFSANAPTSTGNWDPVTMSEQPDSIFIMPTGWTSDEGDTGSGGKSTRILNALYYANDNEEVLLKNYHVDGGSSTNTYHERAGNLEWQGNSTSSTPNGESDSDPTFDSTGVVFNISSNAASQSWRNIGVGFFPTSATLPPFIHHYRQLSGS